MLSLPRDVESLPGVLRSVTASDTAHRARLRIWSHWRRKPVVSRRPPWNRLLGPIPWPSHTQPPGNPPVEF